MKNKELTCIVCPTSCTLTVQMENGEMVVQGAGCNRGLRYGEKECSSPVRMLTTTIEIKDAIIKRLPVVSEGEILKVKLNECLEYLYQLEVSAPVRCGEVLVEDLCGTGVNLISARTLEKI